MQILNLKVIVMTEKLMSEKRFRITTIPKSNAVAFDEKEKKYYIGIDFEDLLNDQQATIDEQKIIIEERDVANERLNRFLIEIGLEKEYIKWEFKKRCVE